MTRLVDYYNESTTTWFHAYQQAYSEKHVAVRGPFGLSGLQSQACPSQTWVSLFDIECARMPASNATLLASAIVNELSKRILKEFS